MSILQTNRPRILELPEPPRLATVQAAALLGMDPGPWMAVFANRRGIEYTGPAPPHHPNYRGMERYGEFRQSDVERVARELAAEALIPMDDRDWVRFQDVDRANRFGPDSPQAGVLRALGCRVRTRQAGQWNDEQQVCAFDLLRLAAIDYHPGRGDAEYVGPGPTRRVLEETDHWASLPNPVQAETRLDEYRRWMAEIRVRVVAELAAEARPRTEDRARRRAAIIAEFQAAKATYRDALAALAMEP